MYTTYLHFVPKMLGTHPLDDASQPPDPPRLAVRSELHSHRLGRQLIFIEVGERRYQFCIAVARCGFGAGGGGEGERRGRGDNNRMATGRKN